MNLKQQRLEKLRQQIPRISPRQAFETQTAGAAVLLDVREARSIEQGSPDGALCIGRDFLELKIETEIPDPQQQILLLCETGVCSLFAADDLRRLGYQDVHSIDGGFSGWKKAGLPWSVSLAMDEDSRVRYSRHLLIPEIGEAGQIRLLQSRVLVVGAGGLGSPVALYLAAAGVGTLGIIDDDVVEKSNLQRQIIHDQAHLGVAKTESARYRLKSLNPAINVVCHQQRLEADNAASVLSDYDLVVDGSDNLGTRYLLNDTTLKLGMALVYGAIFRFQGQVSVFNYRDRGGSLSACYRCLFQDHSADDEPPTCGDIGVLGVLPGVIGSLQATEALKLLLGIGEPLAGRLLSYDALAARFRETRLTADPACGCRKHQ